MLENGRFKTDSFRYFSIVWKCSYWCEDGFADCKEASVVHCFCCFLKTIIFFVFMLFGAFSNICFPFLKSDTKFLTVCDYTRANLSLPRWLQKYTARLH